MKTPYFNDDHEAFRQSVRKFVEGELTPQAEEWEKERRIPKRIFARLGEMGYLGINYSEELGGSGLDFFYSVVFFEELVRCQVSGLMAAVGVQSYMATPPIMHLGSQYIKDEFLLPAIQGKKIGALAITEPNAGSDVAAIRTSARLEGEYYIVNGSKTFITNGCNADFVTMAVRTSQDGGFMGISLLVVDTTTSGFRVARKLDKLGWWSSDTAELAFEDMRVPRTNLLGQEGKGFYYIMNNFQLERLIAAITSMAGIDLMLSKTLEYMASREAFGRPISKFQVLRHRLADLYSELEAVRALTYQCSWGYDRGDYLVKEITMAKLLATELAVKTANECVQMHGGYGVMEEYPVARMYRDTRIGTIGGGTSEIMREILGKIVIDGMDFSTFSPADDQPEEEASFSKKQTMEAGGSQVSSENPALEAASVCTCAQLVATYPARFLPDKAGGFNGTVHFKLTGTSGGQYTAVVKHSELTISEGLEGTTDCLVEASDETFLGIEKGTLNPQMAFMMGKIKVSNVGIMLKFMAFFRPLR
ncbi:MAG: hypothetical protein A2284_04990 [Deltaproteobacteria bacterium RIFOXYA12_FULL_61_11]|nr:MAG: hypothetical protein A2284_04990 [Deltaproteobacteria bacterium RIFOXYA12_FULL_61_11]